MKEQSVSKKQQNSAGNIVPFQTREQKREAAKFAVVPEQQLTIQLAVYKNNDLVVALSRYSVEELGLNYAKLLYGLKDLCNRKPGKAPHAGLCLRCA